METETHIDAKGLLCPLPVLRLRKVLEALPAGACVVLEATDGASWIDVPHFCAQAGHTLLEAEDLGHIKRYRIRK
ncbi:sulfurtransferase TusA family protein [Sedimentimonas flavescens]|uniref:sulfurtransferase TusA family protein n=1 Tax=Sedimentimonas flavescens TaxID=2851012 RepID=UPI001C49E1FB|nr:sulfurtransferase TusA family protein [Sedimentimonas flavescens]MBW0158741.1 sulfurtransferase TusA family protein [Sedimentimonas flavescens]